MIGEPKPHIPSKEEFQKNAEDEGKIFSLIEGVELKLNSNFGGPVLEEKEGDRTRLDAYTDDNKREYGIGYIESDGSITQTHGGSPIVWYEKK
jgi:hypothetical protein